ncbi:hypothetical protein [Tsukamurella pseudospumae]|nr:hypothetical protein [Tsukamurella pseudospumae]
MSETTVRWVCDSCNEWIEDAGAAEVIFTYDSSRAKGHRIVHKSMGERNCSDVSALSYGLESVLGEDGLARLLSDAERSDIASLTGVTHRVHVPYYEAAR